MTGVAARLYAQAALARRRAGGAAVITAFKTLSALGRMTPLSNPARYGVSVEHGVAYADAGHPLQRLDVYRRRRR